MDEALITSAVSLDLEEKKGHDCAPGSMHKSSRIATAGVLMSCICVEPKLQIRLSGFLRCKNRAGNRSSEISQGLLQGAVAKGFAASLGRRGLQQQKVQSSCVLLQQD